MILIVEGTDGTGKTEFARWYADRTGATYLHAGPPSSSDPWEEYLDSLEPGRDYVLDRWHVGEIIWPDLFNRPSIIPTPGVLVDLCDALHLHGAQLLTIHRDPGVIKQTLEARGESDEAVTRSLIAQRAFMMATSLIAQQTMMQASVVQSDIIHAMVAGR